MIICSAVANAAHRLFAAKLMLWACRAVVELCEVGGLGKWARGVLTGMRQKSATQFGGVPRVSRLVGFEVMVLIYEFMVSMLENGEIPTSVMIVPSRQDISPMSSTLEGLPKHQLLAGY